MVTDFWLFDSIFLSWIFLLQLPRRQSNNSGNPRPLGEKRGERNGMKLPRRAGPTTTGPLTPTIWTATVVIIITAITASEEHGIPVARALEGKGYLSFLSHLPPFIFQFLFFPPLRN